MSKKLLLVSTSTVHGSGYLDACEPEVRAHFEGAKNIIFVPYALHDRDAYARVAESRFEKMGFSARSIHRAANPKDALAEADGVFIGGGNTFRLLTTLYEEGLVSLIRERCEAGTPYMGTSAGSNVACVSIKTTNDMPIVYPPSFDALGLVPFNINPHYIDPDPASKHMGETRETRIREFHEMNTPAVVGLREGALLRVHGEEVTLLGSRGARLFRAGQDPKEYETGARLDFLMDA